MLWLQIASCPNRAVIQTGGTIPLSPFPQVGVPIPIKSVFNSQPGGCPTTHQDAGGSHSADANNLVRAALGAEVVRVAIAQVHAPSAVSVDGNGRARPEIIIHIGFRHPVGVSGSISRRYGANAVGVGFHEFFLSR